MIAVVIIRMIITLIFIGKQPVTLIMKVSQLVASVQMTV